MAKTTQGITCANCGDAIGSLETPHVWQDHCVCDRCYAKLATRAGVTVAPADDEVIDAEWIEPDVSREITRQLGGGQDIPGLSSSLPAQPIAYAQPAAYSPPQPAPTHSVVTQVFVQNHRQNGRGLIIAGAVVMAVSVPLCCVYGIGFFTFFVGLILLIVGLCL